MPEEQPLHYRKDNTTLYQKSKKYMKLDQIEEGQSRPHEPFKIVVLYRNVPKEQVKRLVRGYQSFFTYISSN